MSDRSNSFVGIGVKERRNRKGKSLVGQSDAAIITLFMRERLWPILVAETLWFVSRVALHASVT